jgi:hypothetical protein
MAKQFFARVELHDVGENTEAYETLHAMLAIQGFLRTVTLANKVKLQLPTGSYIGLKLPRFSGRVVKAYATFFFSKQSSNASGVS